MGNLSKSKIKLYICDNKLRSCVQFALRCKSAPGCLFAPPNLHHLQRWSKVAPGCRFAPGCIFIKHRLHDQNTPQVQIYTPGVYLHRGVYCAYERGFKTHASTSLHIYIQQYVEKTLPSLPFSKKKNNVYSIGRFRLNDEIHHNI